MSVAAQRTSAAEAISSGASAAAADRVRDARLTAAAGAGVVGMASIALIHVLDL